MEGTVCQFIVREENLFCLSSSNLVPKVQVQRKRRRKTNFTRDGKKYADAAGRIMKRLIEG